MTTTVARRGGFVTAALAFFGLFGIAPVALVAAARLRFGSPSPLAGIAAPANWSGDAILESLRDPLSDDLVVDVIVRCCLLVAWAAIASIAVTTVLEVGHLVRHRGISMPAVRGLGWAQGVAQFIAAGLLVLSPVVTPRASLATALDAGRIVLRTDAPHPTVVAAAPLAAATPAVETGVINGSAASPRPYVVEQGESVYSIAEHVAARSPLTVIEVANAILDLNLGREMNSGQCFTSPAYIEVGWELLVPASTLAPGTDRDQVVTGRDEVGPLADTADPTGGATGDSSVPSDAQSVAASHVVERDDTLWSIAATHLADPEQWPLIWERNAGAEMPDGRFFDDPHTILAGWELEIPTPPAATRDATDRTPAERKADVPGLDMSPDQPTTTDESTTTIASLPTSTTEAVEVSTSEPAPDIAVPVVTRAPHPDGATPGPPTATPTTTPTTTPATQPTQPNDDRGGVAPSAPAPLGFGHAALFAAGVLTLVGARRRGRLRSARGRSRVPPPLPSVVDTHRRLRAAGAGERSARIDVGIRAAAHALIGSDARICLVLVSTDGAVELWLTRRAELPAVWTTDPASDGRRWTLSASVPIEELAESARLVGAPCVALVQLGDADGRAVLIDLEACATLVVESEPDAAREIIMALATGLAASSAAEVAHLIGVTLPAEALLAHRNAHHTDTAASAFELATSLVGTTIGTDRTTFVLRSLRTGGEVWEPAVVFLLPGDADPAEIEPLLPAGGHGLGVVLPTSPDQFTGVQTRLVCSADGWRLHLGGEVLPIQPVGLSEDDLRKVVDVVEDAAAPLSVEEEPAVDGRDPDRALPDHEIIVRLMGEVDIVSRDDEPGSFERSKTVELIAWLATHREKSTRAAARTAMWDLDVRDATFANVVSEARRGLGRLVMPRDGEEWLARTLTEQLPLHPAVVTDADLIEQRLTQARGQATVDAIETLRPAVDMIRNMPFAGTGYLWPDAEGITSNLVLLAIAASTELAEHALQVSDIELVFWATGRGLTVLPGHEELIGLRMRAHAESGDLAGVRSEWEAYERVIIADPWSDGEPSPKLVEIRRSLLA